MQALHADLRRMLVVHRLAVAAALEEIDVQLHRIARQRFEIEDQRPLDQPVDEQAVLAPDRCRECRCAGA